MRGPPLVRRISWGDRRRAILRVGSWVLMVAAVAFVALALLQNWSETEKALKAADPWWIALALLFAFGSMIWMAWRWNAAMRAAGGEEASSSRVIGMFFLGELGKYVPGGFGACSGVPNSHAATGIHALWPIRAWRSRWSAATRPQPPSP